MSETSQDTLINNSQEDILSSKLENTKIDVEDPENPLKDVTNKVYVIRHTIMISCDSVSFWLCLHLKIMSLKHLAT